MSADKWLICVVGPTAIGKTRLGIALANHFNTHILSADSRQFFKEMRIGTAVPSEAELAAAPHHFIQHKSIFDSYSVGDFERDAITLLDELFQKNQVVVLVGGSGLYVDAVTQGLDHFPEVAPEIREALNQRLKEQGIEALQNQLHELDPNYYEQVDRDNPHRLIRALEICLGSGQPYSSFLGQEKPKRKFNICTVGLTADRPLVYSRISQRVDQMVSEGLLEEVKALMPYRELNALQTVGYRELFPYFDGSCTLEEALDEIKKNTRRFAKRQFTWFKRNPDTLWFEYDAEDIPKKVAQVIGG